MRLAVIADVHSNIYALKAVLDDIRSKKVDKVMCAGDLVGYAPFPNEVIELIKKENIPTVMGNYDDGVGFWRLVCGCDYKTPEAQVLGEKSIAWTKENTSEENKKFLQNLPKEIKIYIGQYKIMLVHGSPRALNEYLKIDTAKEILEEVLSEIEENVLICGHTHIPFHRIVAGKHLINAGSVGKPKHGDPQALYALIDINEGIKVDFIKVPYDYERTAQAIEKSELPNEFATLIREGKEC